MKIEVKIQFGYTFCETGIKISRNRIGSADELKRNKYIKKFKWKFIKLRKAEKSKRKIFCIGFGKTGTTSLEQALSDFGYRTGDQAVGEILAEDWGHGRFDRIISFCYTADAFQDVPFSLPNLYKKLDKAFPESKFILTIRDDEHQWFDSLVRFHSKLFSKTNTVPTEVELANVKYRYKGWILDMMRLFWGYPEVKLYDPCIYKQKYIDHINDVKNYFRNRPNDLLVMNVAQNRSYQNFGMFLGFKVSKNKMFS